MASGMLSSMDYSEKVRENRLRKKADRMGYRLVKSRRRDVDAIDYGLYAIVYADHGGTIHAQGVCSPYALTLDEVEAWL